MQLKVGCFCADISLPIEITSSVLKGGRVCSLFMDSSLLCHCWGCHFLFGRSLIRLLFTACLSGVAPGDISCLSGVLIVGKEVFCVRLAEHTHDVPKGTMKIP